MGVGIKVDGVMVITGLVVLAAGYAYYKKDQVIKAIDPTSENNLAYRGANEVLETVTGVEDDTLGEFVYRTQPYNPIAWLYDGVAKLQGINY